MKNHISADSEFSDDIICSVLASVYSKETIDRILEEFIPGYEQISTDYAEHHDDPDYVFATVDEMLNYFIEQGLDQTFYWNNYKNNPDRIMVGARVLSDKKLVISLTVSGGRETEEKYYLKLKKFLNAEIGVISFVNPPEYENGEDFIERYKDVWYDYEIKK
jgi:hypothetical protein